MGGECSTYWDSIDVYRELVGKPEGKRSLEGHRRRWKDNIKTGLQQVGLKDMDLTDVTKDRFS